MSRWLATLAVACVAPAAGCVEPFNGSDIEMTLANFAPSESVTQANLTPPAHHYELWVTQNDIVVPVTAFKVVPVVDFNDPCTIDYFGDQAGMGIREAAMARRDAAVPDSTAALGAADQLGRMMRLNSGVKAVVTYQPGNLKPDPSIATMAPAERLAACNAFIKEHPKYYVSNYRVMTSPAGGLFLGLIDGNDPDSGGFIGGITIITDYNLGEAVEVFLTLENDDNPDTKGPVIISGLLESRNRGVRSATMTDALVGGSAPPRGTVGIYSDFDHDDVNF